MDSAISEAAMLFWLGQTAEACKGFSFDHQGQHRFSPDLSALAHAAAEALGPGRSAEYRKQAGFLVASAFLSARAETACALAGALEESGLALPEHAALMLSKAARQWRDVASERGSHDDLRRAFSFFLTGCQIAMACENQSQWLGPKQFAGAAQAIAPALGMLCAADIEALAQLGERNDAVARFAEHATTPAALCSACAFAACPEFKSAAEQRMLELRAAPAARKNTPKL